MASNNDKQTVEPKTSAVLTTASPKITIVPRTYTEEEVEKIKALREYAYTLRLPESDPYYPWESRWLSDLGCAERYMRAAKFKLDEAKKRIAGTMVWRREFKPDLIPPEEVRVESETGKIILNGFDINGRPIITMHPGRENTKPSDRQLRHLVYVLERAIDLMPPGQDSLVIIVDYKSATLRTNPSISVAAKVLTILQQHYVERLGRAIVVNLPFILSFFYKGISPFLDPITRDKMRFNPDLKELIPDDHLWIDFGGSFNYEFEPKEYWNSLISKCHVAPDGTRTAATDINSTGSTTLITSELPPHEGKGAAPASASADSHSNLLISPTSAATNATTFTEASLFTEGYETSEPRTPENGISIDGFGDADVIHTEPGLAHGTKVVKEDVEAPTKVTIEAVETA